MAGGITAAAMTDIGKVRRKNQDAFGIHADLHLYIVCDGMGGAAGGEIASRMAVDAFLNRFGKRPESSVEPVTNALYGSAMAANAAILARAEAEPGLRGMGSTLVAAQVEGMRLHLVNVGDSRAYLIRGQITRQLTVDHSYLREQVELGLMTQAAADRSPLQSVITRAVGVADVLQPDISQLDLQDRDLVLLTTDGLTRHVSDTEIGAIVGAIGEVSGEVSQIKGQEGLSALCSALIELAKHRGGSDNITCLLLQVAA